MRKELRAGMSGHTYLFVAIQATDAAIVVQDVVGQSPWLPLFNLALH